MTIVNLLTKYDYIQDTKEEIRYRIEVLNDLRDFIAGKKNGKIIRIMNAARVSIKLFPLNEHSFFIDLFSENSLSSTTGLKLLEDELASEMGFYIPVTYHKKAIGAGGLTIQAIMRKYNVFIKFSSGFDCNPNGPIKLRCNNVLIRCPTKNAKEIKPAQKELQSIVSDRSQEHGNTFVNLTRSHMRIMLAQRANFSSDVETKTNSIIILPEANRLEDPTNTIEIKGVLGTSETAARLIKAMLPEDYEFKVAFSTRFEMLVNENDSEFYQKIIFPFRVNLNMEVQVFPNPHYIDGEAPYHQVLLSFMPENAGGLDDAIQALTAYVRDKGLNIIDRGEYYAEPIFQGTAANTSFSGKAKSSCKTQVKSGDSADFRNSDQSELEPYSKQGSGGRSKKPFIPSTSAPKANIQRKTSFNDPPINRPLTPSRVVSATYRDQSAHPYMKLNPKARGFRQSPQNNRLKYQPEDEPSNYKPQSPQLESDPTLFTLVPTDKFFQQSNVPPRYLTTDPNNNYQLPASMQKVQAPLFQFSSNFASSQAFPPFGNTSSIFSPGISDSIPPLPTPSINYAETVTSDDISFYSPKKGKLLDTWSTNVSLSPAHNHMEFSSTVGYTRNNFY